MLCMALQRHLTRALELSLQCILRIVMGLHPVPERVEDGMVDLLARV
jgi:hypothetical protein